MKNPLKLACHRKTAGPIQKNYQHAEYTGAIYPHAVASRRTRLRAADAAAISDRRRRGLLWSLCLRGRHLQGEAGRRGGCPQAAL
jgi:hypothetical protein